MKLRPFELILVIVFIGLAVFALVLLATFQARNGNDAPVIGQVSIWGTLDSGNIQLLLDELAEQDEIYADVTYRKVSEERLAQNLTNALADGVGPDILLLPHENLVEMRKRISPISYESFPQRDISTVYVDGAEIFALSDGLYAYPIAVDPLMMYWNKNLLTTRNLLTPPTTWESLVNTYVPNLTERTFDRTITKSTVAMGEYQNIENAYGILSMLLMQGGTEGVVDSNGTYLINVNRSVQGGQPLTAAADFYTRFSRPNNTLYSWNRSFGGDKQQFLGEDLALYFGYGSEGRDIERQNPNLSFDIAEVPQGASATVRRTYGKFYGLALVKNTNNISGAATMMSVLASATNAGRIAADNDLAPVHRDAVSRGSNDTYGRLYYRSAAIAYGWLNPPRPAIDDIFSTMARDIVDNRLNESEAAQDAVGRLGLEYN